MISDYRPIQPPKLQRELQRPGYSYREYAPCKSLAPYVACYWTLDYRSDLSQPHRIIPDGCVDIIIDLLSPTCWKTAFIAGLMTHFEVMTLAETQSIFGIRFYSESAYTFLKCPLSAFMGHRVYLEEIWGMDGVYFVEEILGAITVSGIIAIVERKLKHMLSNKHPAPPSLLLASMQTMYTYKGNISITDLADKLSFSERHIRRTFDRELGVGPKEMLDIVRFQSMLQELHTGFPYSFTDMALKYGYYDQSHMIRSFKRYYGMTPKQLAKTD